jgi:tRNA pseudouridine38-40 synthase
MKMEVPEAAWVNDLDGSALADAINSYLSPFIRVFGIVPVTRSFRARHDCCTRSYDYLLPAAIIGIYPDTDSSEAEQRVKKLRSLLRLFEGKHAFHNYTIRRLYRPFAQKAYKSRPHTRPHNDCNDEQHDKSSTVKNSSEFEFLDEDDYTEELSDNLAGELADEVASTFAHEIQCVGEVLKTSTPSSPGENVVGRRAWWLPTPDGSDKVWSSHFRKVLSCSCELPEVYGESQFIRISITGSSFMVHQIRKMIGTAIAVFHELLPGDIIPVSLARHSRIVLPLAPPDGLILSRNEFMPFRLPPIYQKKSDIEAQTPPVLRTQQKLPKLEMSSGILNKVEEFCENVLMPDIAPLISAKTPTWSAWMTNLERNVKIPEAEMAEVRAAWTEWREQSVRLRQIRSHICKDVAELC